MGSIATLNVKLTAGIGGFTSQMAAAARPLMEFSNRVSSVGTMVTGMLGGLSAVGAVGTGLKLAADFEQASVAMEVMLGSADKAKALLQDLTDFAASTPFEFPELVSASRKLVAFGTKAGQVVPELRMLGDISAGVGMPVGELAELYGKARVQGTLFAEDINQLTGRGIPIIQAFAKQLGVSEAAVKKMASEGQIGFANLQRAFATMSGPGGQFAGMMDRQSKTVAGVFSTLKDSVGISLRQIGQALIENLDVRNALTQLSAYASKAGEKIVPVVAAAARWVMQNKELLLSIAKVTAVVGTAMIVLPKLVSTVQAVGTVASTAGSILKFGFAHPLATIGVAAVGLFTATLARSIAMNESWSESAYHMTRSMGLFNNATQNLAEAQAAFGQSRHKADQINNEIRAAKTVEDRVDSTRELVSELQRQYDTVKKILDLQKQSGSDGGFYDFLGASAPDLDMGYSQRNLDNIRKQMRAAQAKLEQMENERARQRAARMQLELAPLNAPTLKIDADAAKRADNVRKTVDTLIEQARTYGMSAHQVELYKLAQQGATQAQLQAADAAMRHVEALRVEQERRQAVQEVIRGMREQAETFGLTSTQMELYRLRKMGATQAELAHAAALGRTLDAQKRWEDMQGRAKSVFDATRTPLERYDARIGELNDLLRGGAINWETYGRAVRAARAELEQSVAAKVPEPPPAPDLFKAGTAAAQRFVFDNAKGVQRLTKDEMVKAQLAEAKTTNRVLDRIDRNTGKAAAAPQVVNIQ